MRQAAREIPRIGDLADCTLYSSTEPCLMCAGAVAWSSIGTVVFGLSQRRLNEIPAPRAPRFRVPTDLRQLLSGVQPGVNVRGPLLETEALVPHDGYWTPESYWKADRG